MKTAHPAWVLKAMSYVGVKEVKGVKHNNQILKWWGAISSAIKDDETPWCAAFVGAVLEECGIRSTRSAAARSYCKWGVKLNEPANGAIVTFWRGSPTSWSGHVGIVVGRDRLNNIMVLGGNQGDTVSIKPFDTARVLSYAWPKDQPLPRECGIESLTVMLSNGALSCNES